ncbi:MAG: hypothetical protein EOO50_05245 [Flavobacterium sp.]|uniref:hypothetical protein n=1 Tax=Flavobacterium sp. TaxID=239 RepID=UPI00120C9D54|nr:hypothetical protein [Flavobacterium sp.]RZJ67689.1 MAG: hypothetical protein EOO50_05245 [Flavobacterium sp.]
MAITGITNYTFEEFLLVDYDELRQINEFLQWLSPIQEFEFEDETIQLLELDSLSFGDVTNVRDYLSDGNPESLVEIAKLITGLDTDQSYRIPIIEFYGILNTIKAREKQLATMEQNELHQEPDADWILVNGSEKMGQFGVLNIIDDLAGGDICKWEAVENLPYWTVIQKLRMNKTMASLQRAIASNKKQRQNNK